MPKLTTMLGWGMAEKAGKEISDRQKKINDALAKATGEEKKKPVGSFQPKGKVQVKN